MLEYVQNEWSLRGVFGVSKDYVFIFSVSGVIEGLSPKLVLGSFFEVFNLSEGLESWGLRGFFEDSILERGL